jgi:hypothetical protein
MGKPIKWADVFILDQGSPKRAAWIKEARKARAFMDLNFDPLREYGLEEDEDTLPVVKRSSIPRVVRSLYGRIYANPMKPTVGAYEGRKAEEAVTMISDAVFRYEMAQKRGPKRRKLIAEIKRATMDALVTGFGVTDHRVDETLRSVTFPKGIPYHERLDPFDVIFDRRVGRNEDKRHLHIVRCYTKDEFEDIFQTQASNAVFSQIINESIDPEMVDPNLVWVVETQYRKTELDVMYLLPREAQAEIGLPLPPMDENPKAGLVSKKTLSSHINALKQYAPDKYGYLDLSRFTKGVEKFETLKWGTYSFMHAGVEKPLTEEEYVGDDFTVEILGFFPVSSSPYFNGVPFFLADAQNLEIIGETVQARFLMRADNPGMYTKVPLEDHVKERIRANKIGDIVDLELQGEDAPIKDLIMFRDLSPILPYLGQFLQSVHYSIDEEFGTTKEQSGQVPFAGASGRLIDRLLVAGTFMFTLFVDVMNEYLPGVFDRVLRLGAYALPTRALLTIAGENDEQRRQMILDGSYVQRLDVLNADVQLDMTSDQDRALQKEFVVTLAKAGLCAPITAARLLNFEEPERFAREVEQYQRQQNEYLQMGHSVLDDPAMKASVMLLMKRREQFMGQAA